MKNSIVISVATVVTIALFLSIYKKPQRPIYKCKHPDHAYSLDVIDDSLLLYTEDDKLVGIVKLEGQLDSLITLDNQ
jgi:hypothetical protein